MAIYNSQTVTIPTTAANVYSKLADLSNLRSLLDKAPTDQIPEDKRAMFENINVTADSISVPAGPVGDLLFKVVEKAEPSLIKLAAENSPIPLTLAMHIAPRGAEQCEAKVEIDIALPPMLKGMVGGQIQKLADQFGQVLKTIPFA